MADTFLPVQGQDYKLAGGGITATDTSIILQSFNLPDDSTNITMSNFGSIGYGTLEPGTVREENISFTGVTQNADGTATLTGVTRGLKFVSPFDQDTSLRNAHAGATIFRITNSAPYYNQFPSKNNDETITETYTFTNPNIPRMDSATVLSTDDEQFITLYHFVTNGGSSANFNRIQVSATAGETVAAGNVVYLDETDNEWKLADATNASKSQNLMLGIAQGAGTNGNSITNGVVMIGRDANQSGLTQGDPVYISDTAGALSSSPGTVDVIVGYAVSATEVDFFPNFKRFVTKDQQDALGGTSGTPSTSNKYVTNDDTSNSSTASKVARYDGNGDIDVPTTPGGANKAASKTYVDALSRNKKLATSATQVDVRATDVETALFSTTVSADTLSTNNAIKVWIPVNDLDYDLDSVTLTFRLKYGSTTVATASIVTSGTSFDNSKGVIEAALIANASTSAQRGIIKVNTTSDQINSSGSVVDFLNLYASGTATEDSTGALTLAVTYQSSDNSSGKGITTDGYIAEVVA